MDVVMLVVVEVRGKEQGFVRRVSSSLVWVALRALTAGSGDSAAAAAAAAAQCGLGYSHDAQQRCQKREEMHAHTRSVTQTLHFEPKRKKKKKKGNDSSRGSTAAKQGHTTFVCSLRLFQLCFSRRRPSFRSGLTNDSGNRELHVAACVQYSMTCSRQLRAIITWRLTPQSLVGLLISKSAFKPSPPHGFSC